MSEVETLARDLPSLAVVDAPVAELRGWDRNPRRIKPARLEQLKAMLSSSPEMLRARPLICLPDGTVIAGNQRLAAAQALGWESIPAVFVDLDEATAIEWAFRDNNPAGESDDDLAAVLLADLAERGRALDMTGFAPSDLSALLRRVAPKNDPDAVPPVPEKAKSKRGVVYELGNHRLMCGDATSAEDVAALMDGSSAALLVTDPPYGVGVDHRWRKDAFKVRLGPDRAAIEGDDRFAWIEAYRLTDASVAYVWHSALHAGSVQAELEEAGFDVRQQIVWAKAVFAIGRSAYQWKHETCWYAVRRGATARWFGGRSQTTVWEAASPIQIFSGGGNDTRTPHPTQKPSAIFEPPISNHTEPGDIVYDPFLGSGTTLIAAEQLGRCCFGLEIDPAYCDVIRQRYADYVNDQKWAP